MFKRALFASVAFALAGCTGTPIEESSSSLSSEAVPSSSSITTQSSVQPVSSSETPASSSSEASSSEPISSAPAISSSSSSAAPNPQPVAWNESFRAGMNEWDSQCLGCHGEDGTELPPQGIGIIDVADWQDRDLLIKRIEDTMPFGNTGGCVGNCASLTADYMLSNYPRPPVEVVSCEGDITDHLNPPIRSLTTQQYGQLIGSVFAPLNLNLDNLLPFELMKDSSVGGFTNNSGVVVDNNNLEDLIDFAEAIGNRSANNFDQLMGCGKGENCVRQFIQQYGEQLYREGVSNVQQNELVALYNLGSTQNEGIKQVVMALLLSPQTLYQYEQAVTNRSPLSAKELASRLSFMIWNQAPDSDLLAEVASININNADQLAAIAEAMLQDERAAQGIGQFYKDYLHIDPKFSVNADTGVGGSEIPYGECTTTGGTNATSCQKIYGSAATDCRDSRGPMSYCVCGTEACALQGSGNGGGEGSGVNYGINGLQAAEEIKRFAAYLTTQTDGTFGDLMNSRKAFVDQATANIYGVSDQFQSSANTYLGGKEVMLDADERAGLLTRIGFVIHGGGSAVGLASPTDRGIVVRETVLCQGLPSAPDDVAFPDLPDPATTTWVQTVKDIHLGEVENACTKCHKPMDPVGFAFEHYTLNGEYIDTYPNAFPVDASGWFEPITDYPIPEIDGATFTDAIDMSQMLSTSPAAANCFTERWVNYALVRDANNNQDACAVDQVAADFKNKGYSLKDLIVSIVRSPAFSFRNPE